MIALHSRFRETSAKVERWISSLTFEETNMTMDRDPNLYKTETHVNAPEARGSNTLAYIIGGLVVALGLIAFLFYDGGNNDVSTTGSTNTTQTDRPAASPTGPGAPSNAPAATPMTPSSPAPAQQ
jgi:hypothetical protein